MIPRWVLNAEDSSSDCCSGLTRKAYACQEQEISRILQKTCLIPPRLYKCPESMNWSVVTILNCAKCQLQSFPSEIFIKAIALKYLNLSNNLFKDFNIYNANTDSLEVLDLSNNVIKSFNISDAAVVSFQKSLRVLDLSNNFIVSLNSNIAKLTSLGLLRTRGNRIESLGNNLILLERWLEEHDVPVEKPLEHFLLEIQILDLSSQGLHKIPREIFSYFKHLTVLNLSNNSLLSVPSELAEMSSVKLLDLTNNRTLCEFPPVVWEWMQRPDLEVKIPNHSNGNWLEWYHDYKESSQTGKDHGPLNNVGKLQKELRCLQEEANILEKHLSNKEECAVGGRCAHIIDAIQAAGPDPILAPPSSSISLLSSSQAKNPWHDPPAVTASANLSKSQRKYSCIIL